MHEKNPNFFDSKVQQERVLNHKSGTQVLLQSIYGKKTLNDYATQFSSFSKEKSHLPHLLSKLL